VNPHDLPEPDATGAAHSRAVVEAVAARIERDGPLPLDRYLELVLYAPGLGYYAAGATKLGAAGDFVTAPELGDVFARCLRVPVAEALRALDGGDVLELGAGSGRMASDLLAGLAQLDALPARYRILEVSADLAERQRACIANDHPDLIDRVEWLTHAPEAPFRGVIVGNEVVDALPARRYRKVEEGTWCETRVGLADGALTWVEAAPETEAAAWLAGLEDELDHALPVGCHVERQAQLGAWARSVTGALERGRILLIDYGHPRATHYAPGRSDGTLVCHYRHRAHGDPFWYPGLNDVSVHVEFTALAEAFDAAGLEVDGLTTQAQFLIGCGLGSVVGEATEDITQERVSVVQQVRHLADPGEMGERFLVLTAHRDLPGPGPGFQRNRLDWL